MPESSAIGTGSALYAAASQNFPSIRIMIGTSDALPSAESFSRATARGPSSFLRGILRSPGLICGSSSCAAAISGQKTAPEHHVIKNAAIHKLPRYRIPESDGERSDCERNAGLAIAGCVFLRKNAMNINDKAPDFTLQDENGKELALKDLRGKTVILFFYPRANTPG